jgi:hypothetical protein
MPTKGMIEKGLFYTECKEQSRILFVFFVPVLFGGYPPGIMGKKQSML